MSNSSYQRSDESYISFNESPLNANSSQAQNYRSDFRKSYGNQFQHRSHYHSTPYNRNNRNNRNFHNSRQSTPFHQRYQNASHRKVQPHDRKPPFDIVKYFHTSMLENPWAELEKKLNEDESDSQSEQSMCSDNEISKSDSSDSSVNEGNDSL